MKIGMLPPLILLLGLCSCRSIYYGAMEKVGIHKRDILVDRVQEARDTQDQAKKQAFLRQWDAATRPASE